MEEPRREDGGSGRFVISRVSTAHGEVEKAKLSSTWEGSEVAERIFGPFSALRMTLETDGDRCKCHHGGIRVDARDRTAAKLLCNLKQRAGQPDVRRQGFEVTIALPDT